jgi:hypothetical protein
VIATAGVCRDDFEQAGVGFHPVGPDVSIGDRETIRRTMNPTGRCRAPGEPENGEGFSAEKCNADLAASVLKEILENLVYAERASSVGNRVRADDGAGIACLAIEQYLREIQWHAVPPHPPHRVR